MTLSNKGWAAGTIGSFLLFVASYYFIPAPWFGEIGNGIMASVALGVVVTYSLVIADAVKHPQKGRVQILSLGIWLGAVAITGRGFLSMYWRFVGRPDDITDGFLWMFIVFLSTVSLGLHLLAPGAIQGHIPNQNFTRLGTYAALGTVIVSLAMWWTTF